VKALVDAGYPMRRDAAGPGSSGMPSPAAWRGPGGSREALDALEQALAADPDDPTARCTPPDRP
jgi:hypothetical protein